MSFGPGFDGALGAHLHSSAPLLILLYSGEEELNGILVDIELQLASERVLKMAVNLEEALSLPSEGCVAVFVVPLDQQEEVIGALETRRDRLVERRTALVLLLKRDSAAIEQLRRSPFLASFARGRILDKEVLNQVNLGEATRDFERQSSQAPDEFLRAWEEGSLPPNADNHMLAQLARFLLQEA